MALGNLRVRFGCFVANTDYLGRIRLEPQPRLGRFRAKRYLFGCLVDLFPLPDATRAMPKFPGRANQGILVGYRLQPSGKWGRDYQVFLLSYSADSDYKRPHGVCDLIPITAQEVKATDPEPQFPTRDHH